MSEDSDIADGPEEVTEPPPASPREVSPGAFYQTERGETVYVPAGVPIEYIAGQNYSVSSSNNPIVALAEAGNDAQSQVTLVMQKEAREGRGEEVAEAVRGLRAEAEARQKQEKRKEGEFPEPIRIKREDVRRRTSEIVAQKYRTQVKGGLLSTSQAEESRVEQIGKLTEAEALEIQEAGETGGQLRPELQRKAQETVQQFNAERKVFEESPGYKKGDTYIGNELYIPAEEMRKLEPEYRRELQAAARQTAQGAGVVQLTSAIALNVALSKLPTAKNVAVKSVSGNVTATFKFQDASKINWLTESLASRRADELFVPYGASDEDERAVQQARGRMVVGLIPVVGTAVFWNEMTPAWRGISVAGDALVLGSIVRLPRTAAQAVKAAVREGRAVERAAMRDLAKRQIDFAFEQYTKTVASSSDKAQAYREYLNQLEKTVIKKYDSHTKAIDQYAGTLDSIEQTKKAIAAQKALSVPDDTLPATLRTLIETAPEQKAAAMRKSNAFIVALQKATDEQLAGKARPGTDMPREQANYGKEVVETVEGIVRDAYRKKTPSSAQVERQMSRVETQLKNLPTDTRESEIAALKKAGKTYTLNALDRERDFLTLANARLRDELKVARAGELQKIQAKIGKAQLEREILQKGFQPTRQVRRDMAKLDGRIKALQSRAQKSLRETLDGYGERRLKSPTDLPDEPLPPKGGGISPSERQNLEKLSKAGREKYEREQSQARAAIKERAEEAATERARPTPRQAPKPVEPTPKVVPVPKTKTKTRVEERTSESEKQRFETPDQRRERLRREQEVGGAPVTVRSRRIQDKPSEKAGERTAPGAAPKPFPSSTPARAPSDSPSPERTVVSAPFSKLTPRETPSLEPRPEPELKAPPDTPPKRLPDKPPRKIPVMLPKNDEQDKTWTPEQIKSAVGFKQGFSVVAVKEPYSSQRDIRVFRADKAPSELRVIPMRRGTGSARASFVSLSGKPPAAEKHLDIGIMDAFFSRRGLRFRVDQKRRTKGDLTISQGKGNGLKSIRRGKVFHTKIGQRNVLSRRPLGKKGGG